MANRALHNNRMVITRAHFTSHSTPSCDVFAAKYFARTLTPVSLRRIYRYIWAGRRTAAGINPFEYVPAAQHLRACATSHLPKINRRDFARNINAVGTGNVWGPRGCEHPCVDEGAMVGFEA